MLNKKVLYVRLVFKSLWRFRSSAEDIKLLDLKINHCLLQIIPEFDSACLGILYWCAEMKLARAQKFQNGLLSKSA